MSEKKRVQWPMAAHVSHLWAAFPEAKEYEDEVARCEERLREKFELRDDDVRYEELVRVVRKQDSDKQEIQGYLLVIEYWPKHVDPYKKEHRYEDTGQTDSDTGPVLQSQRLQGRAGPGSLVGGIGDDRPAGGDELADPGPGDGPGDADGALAEGAGAAGGGGGDGSGEGGDRPAA